VLSTAVPVLAHQGGWDEILMVLTPIAVFALLLKVANSRANKARDAAAERQAADETPVEE
jgi:cyanate permease